MSWDVIVFLFLTGTLCGAINAIAGGGTLLGFPVLLSVGLPPSVANASNFIATMPGYAAAIPSYMDELRGLKSSAVTNTISSAIGAITGSILLVIGGDTIFSKLIPYLLCSATLLYAFSGQINAVFSRDGSLLNTNNNAVGNVILFVVCIYGGYFGAGLGIIMFSVLRIIGYLDFHEANALKNVIITIVSLVSIAVFASGSLISWPESTVMMAGSALGGYQSAKYAKNVPQKLLRQLVIAFGTVLTIYYFYDSFR